MSYQVQMVNLEELISKSHQYRQLIKGCNFSEVEKQLASVEKDKYYKGYGVFAYSNVYFCNLWKIYKTEN